MGKHSIDKHQGYKRHMRRRKVMFFVYDMSWFSVGLLVGVLVTSLLVILLEGGL
jgi:hypothetical protein